MTRRPRTTLQRARLFEANGGTCHLCGCKIAVGEPWDLDHVIALEISGDDGDDNLRPAHRSCHRAKGDHTRIAKAKRVRAKHIGAHRPKSTLPGSRASNLKRKLDGTVVPRN